MCGICGEVDWRGEASRRDVTRMVAALGHRGPDGQGLWRDDHGRAVLGHTRLKVLDLSAAADQPMLDSSGAVGVLNGEVYSYPDLRRRLEGDGRTVRSSGDTEPVIGALARWGPSVLESMNGMFALALWEPVVARLTLVRDRLGIKPLFWVRHEHGLVFASEIPALLAHSAVQRRLDKSALRRWLQLGYLAGDRTLLRGIHKLPPGHLLRLGPDGLEVRSWYDLGKRLSLVQTPADTDADAEAAAEKLQPLVQDAVRMRLVSDVPLGCFLSGGVDSTVVAAAAAADRQGIEALTVAFADGSDESPVAVRTAAALGLEHRVEICTVNEMQTVVDEWSDLAADPLADPSLVPTRLVSRAARKRWTVALSGDGGDELLSGYPRLRLMPRIEPFLGVPKAVRSRVPLPLPARRWAAKARAAIKADGVFEAYQALQGVWPAADVGRLTGRREVEAPWPTDLRNRVAHFSRWTRWRLLDTLTFLPERVLAKVDRASMASSLEVRVPLLDHRVVEHLLALPSSLARDKRVLRRVADRLGAPKVPRSKTGFEVPLGHWLRHGLKASVAAALHTDTIGDLGLDHKVLEGLWQEHQAGRADHGERLLAVAVLSRWVERWLN